MAGYPPKHIAHIPREILEEHSNIEIRNDFIDCSIDVCSVEVRRSHPQSCIFSATQWRNVSSYLVWYTRSLHCFRITSTMAIFDAISSMAYFLRISS